MFDVVAAKRRTRAAAYAAAMPEEDENNSEGGPRFIGSVGQRGGFTQQNVTYHEAAAPVLDARPTGRDANSLTFQLTLNPQVPVAALTIRGEDPAIQDLDIQTSTGTMTNYMKGQAGNRPFVSCTHPDFPVTLTIVMSSPEIRAGLFSYNFEPVNLGFTVGESQVGGADQLGGSSP